MCVLLMLLELGHPTKTSLAAQVAHLELLAVLISNHIDGCKVHMHALEYENLETTEEYNTCNSALKLLEPRALEVADELEAAKAKIGAPLLHSATDSRCDAAGCKRHAPDACLAHTVTKACRC